MAIHVDKSPGRQSAHRSLELVIGSALAEQWLIERRLQRAAEARQHMRRKIGSELRREHLGPLPQSQEGQAA